MGKEGAIKTRRWAGTEAIWKRREKEGDIQAFPSVPHKSSLEFVLAEIQNKQNVPGFWFKVKATAWNGSAKFQSPDAFVSNLKQSLFSIACTSITHIFKTKKPLSKQILIKKSPFSFILG